MKIKFLFMPAVALTLFAQTPAPEPPVNRAASRLVEISVVVRDKNGPVKGLTQDDFTIFDKGKAQKIASFLASATQPAMLPPGPGVFVNRPDPKGVNTGITVLLLDTLNTPVSSEAFVRQQFLQALGSLRPADRVAVFVLGTELRTLRGIGPRDVEGEGSLEELLMNSGSLGGLAAEYQLRKTTDALVSIANHIGHFPGRKSLLWISGAYPAVPDHTGADGPPGWSPGNTPQVAVRGANRTAEVPQIDREIFRKIFSPAVQALHLANVNVYEVDAQSMNELTADSGSSGSAPSRGRNSASSASSSSSAMLRPLQVMVNDTGGRIFENTNDIQKTIRSAIGDAEATYSLGYYPDTKSLDSKFHDLKIQVNRKDAEVLSRKGYLAIPATRPTDAQRTEAIRQALNSPLASTGIGLMAKIDRVAQPKPSLATTLAISANELLLEFSANQWTGGLDLVFSARSADGKDRGTQRSSLNLKFDQTQYDSVMQQSMALTKTLDAADDITELRIVVCDRGTGRLGSLIVPLK